MKRQILICIILVMLFVLSACAEYKKDYHVQFCEGDRCADIFATSINQSKETLQCALYKVSNVYVISTLSRLQDNDVDVHVIVDSKQINSDASFIKPAQKSKHLMHQKFCIIDEKTIIQMSYNPSNSSIDFSDNIIHIKDADIVEEYINEFDRLTTGDTKRVSQNPNVTFCPSKKCLSLVLDEISQATSMIRIATHTITHNKVKDVLLEKHRQNVPVEIILNPTDASLFNGDSIAGALIDIGINVTYGADIRNHNKYIIVDNRTLLVGSFGLSKSGLEQNNEVVLKLHDFELIEKFQEHFDSYNRKILGVKKSAKKLELTTSYDELLFQDVLPIAQDMVTAPVYVEHKTQNLFYNRLSDNKKSQFENIAANHSTQNRSLIDEWFRGYSFILNGTRTKNTQNQSLKPYEVRGGDFNVMLSALAYEQNRSITVDTPFEYDILLVPFDAFNLRAFSLKPDGIIEDKTYQEFCRMYDQINTSQFRSGLLGVYTQNISIEDFDRLNSKNKELIMDTIGIYLAESYKSTIGGFEMDEFVHGSNLINTLVLLSYFEQGGTSYHPNKADFVQADCSHFIVEYGKNRAQRIWFEHNLTLYLLEYHNELVKELEAISGQEFESVLHHLYVVSKFKPQNLGEVHKIYQRISLILVQEHKEIQDFLKSSYRKV